MDGWAVRGPGARVSARRSPRGTLRGLLLLVLALSPLPSSAAPPTPSRGGSDGERASALLQEGQKLSKEGELAQAYEKLEAAQRIYQDLGDTATSAVILSDMGKIQTGLSQYPLAVEHLLRALQLFETIGDSEHQMIVHNRLAIVHLELDELDKALEHFSRALSFAEEAGDAARVASLLSNIGIVHARRGDYQKAIECYTKSLDTGKPHLEPRTVAIYHNNIGVQYARQGDFANALDHYLESVSILEEVGDQQLLGEGYNNAGEAFRLLGRFAEAEDAILKALRMAESSGEKVTQQDCYLNLTLLYEAQGEFEKALKNHRKYTELKDEIFSEHKSAQIVEMQAEFETQKKEDEIRRLKYASELQAVELEKDRQARYLLMLSVGLSMATLAIMVVGYRRKLATQRLLREKNIQLDHYAQEVRRTDLLRRELVGNVSHDLRSPLAVIHGYIETLLIKNAEFTSAQRERYLRVALDGSTRVRRLVSDLFDLSRLEARSEISREPFPFNELVHDTAQQYGLLARKKGVDLQLDIATAAPMVEADLALMERVLQNLLSNAVQYTPPGGTIVVHLAAVDDGVGFTITNSGPGVPPDEIPHLFERYYTSSREGRTSWGSGMGLAIVKKILDLHGIVIDVTSEAGENLSFSFRVPCAARERRSRSSEQRHIRPRRRTAHPDLSRVAAAGADNMADPAQP